MEIVTNNKLIKLNPNIIFFGKNNENKASFINDLIKNLEKNRNIIVNGRKNGIDNYKIIVLNEDTDFEKEFKFTKNNAFKQLIYNDEISKMNEKKIINSANELFNSVDEKINKLLNKKINKGNNDVLKMDIEIPDLNSIIDKFTNIYIDDKLVNDTSISKAMKRKLLYQLYFMDIKANPDQKYIVLLNNFDAYLTIDETIEVLNIIQKFSNINCNFILTTTNDIFEYINLETFNVYKLNEKLYSLNLIESGIEDFIKTKIERNIIITKQEIINIKTRILKKQSHIISKILNSEDISFLLNRPKNIKKNYVVCDNFDEKSLFEKIHQKFID